VGLDQRSSVRRPDHPSLFYRQGGDPGENRFGPDPKALPLVAATPTMGYLAPRLS
jgi:hypothetical protein